MTRRCFFPPPATLTEIFRAFVSRQRTEKHCRIQEPVKQQMPPPDPLPLFSLALAVLRTIRGWSQKELGLASKVLGTIISDYEKGRRSLTRKKLDELAAHLGFQPEAVEEVVTFLRWFRPAEPDNVPFGLSAADVRNIERAAAKVGRAATEAARVDLARALQAARAEKARQVAEEAWNRLRPCSRRERNLLVATAPEFQTWALCERLCTESEKAAAADVRRAMELAELALFVAGRIQSREAWRARVQGYAWAYVGNARRVASQLPAADDAFRRAWQLWRTGKEIYPDWLKEGRLLDLEASLRRDQRRLQESLDLLSRALALAQTDSEACRVLAKQAFTLEEMGDHRLALEALKKALLLVDGTREPRQLFGLQFNQAMILCRLGLYREAAELLPEVRESAIELRNGLDLIRVRWLDARVARAKGCRTNAIEALTQVRAEFTALKLTYDAALSTLELASLYLEEGRTSEVKALAREMAPIFKAQGVHKEALAALRLFCEAVERETVTLELANRLVDYLEKARHDPGLRFAA
jgi:tetratricopeptide (TPR) repeat protein